MSDTYESALELRAAVDVVAENLRDVCCALEIKNVIALIACLSSSQGMEFREIFAEHGEMILDAMAARPEDHDLKNLLHKLC
jgi:hypothetical protein